MDVRAIRCACRLHGTSHDMFNTTRVETTLSQTNMAFISLYIGPTWLKKTFIFQSFRVWEGLWLLWDLREPRVVCCQTRSKRSFFSSAGGSCWIRYKKTPSISTHAQGMFNSRGRPMAFTVSGGSPASGNLPRSWSWSWEDHHQCRWSWRGQDQSHMF